MIKILFICHGNICRSVSAQYIFQDLVERQGIAGQFEIDSAATSREEIGNTIYPPMRKALEQHGVKIGTHHARQVTKQDYDHFNLIIGMDHENRYYLKRILGEDSEEKIHYLLEYIGQSQTEIEDPWYSRNFEKAYQDILAGCKGLFAHLQSIV